MSAYTTYTRMPPAQAQVQTQASRRHPFTSAINQPQGQPVSSPKQQERAKATPPDPPLPRQNSKTTPPSPPKVITDKNRVLEYHRVGFLGEVGCHLNLRPPLT